jgi:hypothetical protein
LADGTDARLNAKSDHDPGVELLADLLEKVAAAN